MSHIQAMTNKELVKRLKMIEEVLLDQKRWGDKPKISMALSGVRGIIKDIEK